MKSKTNRVLIRLFFMIVLAAALFTPTQHAQAYACVTDGDSLNWLEPDAWSGCNSTTPQPGDSVSIGHAIINGQGTIANLAITSGGSLRLGGNLTVTGTGSYILDLAGDIDLYNQQMELSGNGGEIRVCGGGRSIGSTAAGTGSIFLMTAAAQSTKSVVTDGCGTVGTLTFGSNVNVNLSSPTWDFSRFNPGSGLTTINGFLKILYGGGVVTNSPMYGLNSTLIYETNHDITVGTEWIAASSGAGVPHNLTLPAGTTNVIFRSDGGRTLLGNVLIQSGVKITLASCSTCHLTFVGENWENNGGTLQGSASKRVIFADDELQIIKGTATTEFPNLEINNSSDPAEGVFLQVTTAVRRNLYMTDGNLNLDVYDLTIGYDGIIDYGSGIPGFEQMVIADEGRLCKIFGDGSDDYGPFSFLYPIGDIDLNFTPVDMDLPGISGDPYDAYTICLQVFNERHSKIAATITDKYLSRYWKITMTGYGGPDPLFTANFQYDSDDDIVDDEVEDEDEIYSVRWEYTPQKWTRYNLVDATNNYVQVADVTMLSEADYTGTPDDPTAATMAGMEALSTLGGVTVRWETALELDIAGFNIYRSTSPGGERELLNSRLIPGKAPGGLVGASYEFADTTVQAGVTYYYWIETVENGKNTFFGPMQATLAYYRYLPLIKH